MPRRAPTDVDAQIGKKLRELRIKHKVSQANLESVIGITFQQIQKFERGDNRITASQLFHLAAHLGVSVSYFFPSVRNQIASRRTQVLPDPDAIAALEFATTKKGFNLLRAVAALESDVLRDCVIEFVERLAKKTATH